VTAIVLRVSTSDSICSSRAAIALFGDWRSLSHALIMSDEIVPFVRAFPRSAHCLSISDDSESSRCLSLSWPEDDSFTSFFATSAAIARSPGSVATFSISRTKRGSRTSPRMKGRESHLNPCKRRPPQ